MEKIRIHVFISGFVQGVLFRNWTQRQAQELVLVGWVKNLPDGRVEAIFEGEKDRIEEMVKRCHKGPMAAKVEKIEVDWGKATGEYQVFSIKY